MRRKFEVILPLYFLIIFFLSFLWSNSKIHFAGIGQDLSMYYSFVRLFLKYAIKCFTYLAIIGELIRKDKAVGIFARLTVILSLFIFSLKSYNIKELSIILLVIILWILGPDKINIGGVVSFVSFIIGAELGRWDWFDKDARFFLFLPLFIISFSSAKAWKEITIVISSISLFFVMRGLGIIAGILIIFFRFLDLIFKYKGMKAILMLFLSYTGFMFGYFWFLEFQRGMDPFSAFDFIYKAYIPVVIFFLTLVLLILGRVFRIGSAAESYKD